jgi:hypothetical protein
MRRGVVEGAAIVLPVALQFPFKTLLQRHDHWRLRGDGVGVF